MKRTVTALPESGHVAAPRVIHIQDKYLVSECVLAEITQFTRLFLVADFLFPLRRLLLVEQVFD